MTQKQELQDERDAQAVYERQTAKDAAKTDTTTADRDEFARQNSGLAAKQAAKPPVAPEQSDADKKLAADVAAVPVDQLTVEIASTEQKLAALKARQVTAGAQEYPKVLYHTDHAHKTDPVAPVTVADKAAEDEAKGHGWVHDNPAKATASTETPNATQHTREDENQRRDLPAQMAVDQDARTGKGPVDFEANPDAVDDAADLKKAKAKK